MGARVCTTVRLARPDVGPDEAGGSLVQAHILATLQSLGGCAELDALKAAARASAFSASFSALLRKGLLVETRAVARPRVTARSVRAYRLGAATGSLAGRVTPAGQRILDALAEMERQGESPALPEQLLTRAQASPGALKTLVEKGAVEPVQVPVRRAPTAVPAVLTRPPVLTAAQAQAACRLARAIAARRFHAALLFGVTASGKTEVYLDAIARTLEAGRGAIVLVPEIALTTQVVGIFTGRFGDAVAVLHSRLSEGERHDEWRRLQRGEARIAVGARSAVFAPVPDPGLFVIDEEHEASYKQESSPRYSTRDVAAHRAHQAGATLVLGSATPSLETFFAASSGHLELLPMPSRIDDRPLPTVSLVDMRQEFKERRALFSRPLADRIAQRLERGQQVILFLNRRGYSQFVLCRDCGYVARCPHCAVSLAYHHQWSSLRCHHCDYGRPAPAVCPSCAGTRIRGFGVGTEKVEEEAARLFPQARLARLDRDTTARKGAHEGILRRFREGETQILVGTQMVAKGLDFPNVTLVGVVSADTSINMPDFRAAERTFQLLTQVAGRAGRGEHPGEVVVQTFSPEHYSLQMALSQDYPGFYAREIQFREELGYPPFSRFANIVCVDEESREARRKAQVVAEACRRCAPREVEVIGPAPAPLSRLKGLYRFHVVLRAPVDAPLSEIVRGALATLAAEDRRRTVVDIDPMSMA